MRRYLWLWLLLGIPTMLCVVNGASGIPMLIVWIYSVLLYFLPVITAQRRHHREVAPIAIVNLVFGWTIIGWVIALIWSCTSNVKVA